MIDYCIMKVPSNLVKTQFLAKWHQGALDHDVEFPDGQVKVDAANIVVEIC